MSYLMLAVLSCYAPSVDLSGFMCILLAMRVGVCLSRDACILTTVCVPTFARLQRLVLLARASHHAPVHYAISICCFSSLRSCGGHWCSRVFSLPSLLLVC